jgi:peptide/nickel transport system substrate-binding protein
MLKGLRWPLLALVLASGVLAVALITQPDENPNAAAQPATSTPSQPPTDTPLEATEPAVQTTPVPSDAAISSTPNNILIEGLVGQIHKLNPLLATYNPVDRDITSLIFEGLTTTDDYGEIIPDLAASWTVSADGLEYIFVLRDNILWQDGIPFTAEDVVFTIDLMSDPQFPGAPSLHEFWRTIEVDALGQNMVRFRLTQPLASFVDQLRVGIVAAHVLKGLVVTELGKHPFNLSPIGTGPYQIETLTASNGQIDGIQLRAAPVYRQRPEGAEGYWLDRIIFRTYPTADAALDAYTRGEVNSIGSIPYELQSTAQQVPGLSLYTTVAPHVGVVIYNWERDAIRFVRNPRVRMAMAHAINREELVAKHLTGRAVLADSPLLPGSWAYEPGSHWPAYDMAKARSVFETASLVFEEQEATAQATQEAETAVTAEATEPPPDVLGTAEPTDTATAEATEEAEPAEPLRLNFSILTLDDPALTALAGDMAASWTELGFTSVTVDPVDAETLQARLEDGDFDAALIELSFEPNADPDPFVFWHQGQYKTGQNYGGMDDRRVSEALEMARRDANGLNRITHYHRFQALFAERVPALALYYPLYVYGADTRLLNVQFGFLSSPSDRFRHIKDWKFSD